MRPKNRVLVSYLLRFFLFYVSARSAYAKTVSRPGIKLLSRRLVILFCFSYFSLVASIARWQFGGLLDCKLFSDFFLLYRWIIIITSKNNTKTVFHTMVIGGEGNIRFNIYNLENIRNFSLHLSLNIKLFFIHSLFSCISTHLFLK